MTRRMAIPLRRLLMALAVASAPALGAAAPPAAQDLARRVEAAEASYDRASLQLVIDDLAALVAREPGNPQYPYLLARAVFPQIDLFDWTGSPALARAVGHRGITHLETARKLGGASNPDVDRVMGDYYARLGGFEGTFGRMRYRSLAAKHHKAALERAPADPRALIGCAIDKLQAPRVFGGDVPGALDLIKKAISIGPETAAARVWLAKAYAKRGDVALAREAFDRALTLAPKSGFVRGEWELAVREHDDLKTATSASAR